MSIRAHVAWMRQQGMLESSLDRPSGSSGRSSRLQAYYAETDPVSCPDLARDARLQSVARTKAGTQPSAGNTHDKRASSAAKPKVATVAGSAAAPAPRKLGRVETVALALRTDPKLSGMQDIALHMLDDPDLKGLSGDGVVRCLTGLDPALYRASMAKERAAKADAVWAKARGSIDGQRGSPASATAAPASQPAPARKLTAAEMRADAVWDRARASIEANRRCAAASGEACQEQPKTASGDVWARAYAHINSRGERA